MNTMNPVPDSKLKPTARESSSATHRDEDLPLVDATKNGDLTAFEQLVKRYDRRLLRIAQNVTHDLGDAQDVLQDASELREILQKSLETLSPALRIVFLLRDVEELTIEETAEALGLSGVAVKARLFRARLQLRDKLSKHFATGDEHSEFAGRSIRRPLSTEFDNLMTSFLQSELR